MEGRHREDQGRQPVWSKFGRCTYIAKLKFSSPGPSAPIGTNVTSQPSDRTATPEVTSAAITAILPILHSYAMGQLRSKSGADDVVQDTIERAWRSRDSFIPGANMRSWMFQILRNAIIDRYRSGRRLVQDVDGIEAARLITQPDQMWRLRYAETVKSIGTLSVNQRWAILLIVDGLTHVEAAAVMGCPVGTIKGHVRLARRKLQAAGV